MKDKLKLNIDANTELQILSIEHSLEFMALIDRNRPYLRQWLGWLDHTKSVSELEKFIQSTLLEIRDGKGLAMWIWYNQKIIGIIHLRDIDWQHRKAMIGYWVGQEFRGNGFAKNATKCLCEYAFSELKLNRIEIRCAPGNLASQSIPITLGFEKEGQLRDNEWLYDHFVDHIVFSMRAETWQKILLTS